MVKANETQSVPLELRCETQTSPDSTEQVKTTDKLPKKLSVYIPENLNIDLILKENPPTFRFHRDYFLYLIHLVTDIPTRKKDEEYFYVPFYSPLIQRRVRDYKSYLKYLVENNVLLEKRQYIPGKTSRRYRFTDKYQTDIRLSYITKSTLIKSILKFINLDYKLICEDQTLTDIGNLDYLVKWFDGRLKVDFISAKKYLQKLRDKEIKEYNFFTANNPLNAQAKYNCRLLVLMKLHRQEFIHSIDSTAGRLHTILTQLKGDLRQFITFDGKSLVAIDITNSQPYLSTVLFHHENYKANDLLPRIKKYNNSYHSKKDYQNFKPYYLSEKIKYSTVHEDVKQYIEIVKSGQLYENFGQILELKGLMKTDKPFRKQAKEIIFSSIFSPNKSIGYNEPMKIFKEHFPNVFEIYRSVKEKEHRTLACVLQNLEADLVLHQACKIISELRPNAPLFTLHDAIITTDEHKDFVKEILHNVLLNAIGIPPNLKFEEWKKVA